jgi:hypothetical protein
MVLAFSLASAVQRWQRTYGGPWEDMAYDVRQTSDGGYILTGNWQGDGQRHQDLMWLVKTDSLGDTLWTKTIGRCSTACTGGYCVVPAREGGYFVAGSYYDFTYGDYLLAVRTDDEGDTIWTRRFRPEPRGGDPAGGYALDAEQTSDGGYVMAGPAYVCHDSWGDGGSRFGKQVDTPWVENPLCVARCDSLGNLLWARLFGRSGAFLDIAQGVQQTQDGGYIVAGWTNDPPRGEYGLLIRLDSLGDSLWAREYGDTPNRGWHFYGVRVLPDGGFLAVGYWGTDSPSAAQVWLVRTDSTGDTLWTRCYGNPAGGQWGLALWLTDDGGCIIAGEVLLASREIWLLKVNAVGDTEWTRTFPGGGYAYQYAWAIQQTSDGGYVMGGTLRPDPYGSNGWFLYKTDQYGSAAIGDEPANREARSVAAFPAIRTGQEGTIAYFVPQPGLVHVDLFDVSGRRLCLLANGSQSQGWHETHVPGGMAAGSYFLRLLTGEQQTVAKLVVLDCGHQERR